MPQLVPLVILRGSGETTAGLARFAAENGVRTLAHAEGGGVLYVHAGLAREGARARRGEPRSPRGLQPPQPRARRSRCGGRRARVCSSAARGRRLELRGTVDGVAAARPAARARVGERPGARRDDHDRCRRRPRRSGAHRERGDVGPRRGDRRRGRGCGAALPRRLSGTAAFWHATTRFTDGFELTGAPETGINVDWAPGPARPGDLPRPLAPPVPRRRRRHADAVTPSSSSRHEPRRRRYGRSGGRCCAGARPRSPRS